MQGSEQAVLELAITRGYLTPAQVQQLNGMRAQLQASNRPAPLGPLLARFLTPPQLQALQQANLALQANPALLDQPTMAPGGPGPKDVLEGIPKSLKLPDRLGPYALERELARGGMGAVFVARHTELDRRVALKVMLSASPTRLKRFQIEARVTARLRHPNIVAIHEVGEQDGIHYFVMDMIEGEALDRRIKERGPLDIREAATLAEKLARALYYAHSHAILHRDLKPANVLIDPSGEPLITDFGLAKDEEGEGLTKTGQRLGTPAYMAPEQARGARDWIDRRTDVYALGLILYEMLTGQLPYGEGAHEAVGFMVAILHHEPKPPSSLRRGIDRDLETICLKCLEKASPDRYASADALADDLQAWLEGRPITARRASFLERLGKGARRRPVAAAIALMCCVLALVAAGLGQRVWASRRAEQARGVEERGLALVAELRRSGWTSPRADEVRATLGEAVALDPSLFRAWTVLARLALEGGDHAEATRCLARARAVAPLDGEGRFVEGCLHEHAEQYDAALQSYEAAQDAGFRPPTVPLRLARVRAVVFAKKGWVRAAEAERWRALRERPDDSAPLVEIVRARLEADDARGLAGMWIEVFRRLGRAGEPTLQQLQLIEYGPIQQRLDDPQTPARERVRAVLSCSLFPRPAVFQALGRLAEAKQAGILREAARASLLGVGRLSSAQDDARAHEESFTRWCQLTGEGGSSSGAAEALTLLEASWYLTPGDLPALRALRGAGRGPLLRAALGLALALSATREGGIPLAGARRLLSELATDGDALVVARARTAAAALDLIEGKTAPPSGAALTLARQLWLAPGLATAIRPKRTYPAALTRAVRAASPSAGASLAQAYQAIEEGELIAARTAVAAALELEPADPQAQTLDLQLQLLESRTAPIASVRADDPAVLRRCRERLAFTQRFGVVALPAPNGALRVVLHFKKLGIERLGDAVLVRGFGMREYTGVASEESLTLLSRFACDRWDSVELEGQGFEGCSVRTRLHGGDRLGEDMGGILVDTRQRWGVTELTSDGWVGRREWSHGKGFSFLERQTVVMGRTLVSLFLDGAAQGPRARGARLRRLAGNLSVDFRWGGGRVRRLVLEGRWDSRTSRPAPPPTVQERKRFEATLRPLPDSVPLTRSWSNQPTPKTLGVLRRDGWRALAKGFWSGNRYEAPTARILQVRGNFELRGEVSYLPVRPNTLAGLALYTQDADILWFGVGRGLRGPTVRVGLQRRKGLPMPVEERIFREGALAGPVQLRLQRLGEYVFARYRVRGGAEVDLLSKPLYFPLDAEVGVALFGYEHEWKGPHQYVTFRKVDLLVARPGGKK